MYHVIKSLRILWALSLVALTLAGCDSPPWESGMTLVVKVDAPKDGVTVDTPTLTVTGRLNGTEASRATVKVNGADATVKDGKFTVDVTLTEGKNDLKIVASSAQANLNEQRTVTFVPAKKVTGVSDPGRGYHGG